MPKRDVFVLLFLMITMPTLFIIGTVFEHEFICMGIFFVAFFGIAIHRIREESKMPDTQDMSHKSISHSPMHGSNILDPVNFLKTDYSDPFSDMKSHHNDSS